MSKENLVAWLPEPKWAGNETVRKLMGVLVWKEWLKDPSPPFWERLWNRKIEDLAQQLSPEDLREALYTYCPATLDFLAPWEKVEAWEVQGILITNPRFLELKGNFENYLYGDLDQKKEALEYLEDRFDLPGDDPVSQEEFTKELLELSLWEFLELVS